MKVCIVEDYRFKNLFPLTKTRPVFGLRCGKFTIEERMLKALSSDTEEVSFVTRPHLEPVWRLKNKAVTPVSFEIPEDGDRLFLNGRILLDEPTLQNIVASTTIGESALWLIEDTWAAIYLPAGYPSFAREALVDDKVSFSSIKNQHHIDIPVIEYPWDLINYNSVMIEADFSYLDKRRKRLRYPPLPRFTAIMNGKNLMIGSNTEVQPFVTFDARNGPVIVGNNVRIESGTYIKGPVSIDDNCLVSASTKLYENTTLGITCKAGGEISHSIIHGYSNKRHSGFLGNAYLGEWINLGAGTNNSNLKNNYNTVKVRIDGKEIDTGDQFIGLFMGDHCRTAVGTVFNTATFIGVGCNIFGNGFPPKYVKDFIWNGIERNEIYDFDKFIESVRRMMIRREIELSAEEVQLLKTLHDTRDGLYLSSYVENAGTGENELQESS